jgi:hypothetical protein
MCGGVSAFQDAVTVAGEDGAPIGHQNRPYRNLATRGREGCLFERKRHVCVVSQIWGGRLGEWWQGHGPGLASVSPPQYPGWGWM